MQVGSTILIQAPPEPGVPRREATVIEANSAGFVVTIPGEFELPVGTPLAAYFEERNHFMRWPAELLAVRQREGEVAIACKGTGPIEQAENRQTFRVHVAEMNILARVDTERKCQVVDVSSAGLAVIAKTSYKIGELVRLMITHEGRELQGMARVQGVRKLEDGKFRYGFLVPEKKSEMRRALEKMTADIQRAQIRATREAQLSVAETPATPAEPAASV